MSPILTGFVGSLVAGLGTGVGALPILLRRRHSEPRQRLLLAGAGGMMLGATFFSLLAPALSLAEQRGASRFMATVIVAAGVLVGSLAMWGLHSVIPHEHLMKGREGSKRWPLGHHSLFVLAIVLHNFPEGLSVGVAYGAEPATGYAVTLGILAQNLPEGFAVGVALMADGMSRGRAFFASLATGFVEPVGGLVGALAVGFSNSLLPWGLAFAAGAMLFVVSSEVIPETHSEGHERGATFTLTVGFVLMMALDMLLA